MLAPTPRQVGPFLLVAAMGCDRERVPETPPLSVIAACEEPTLETPVACDAPALIEPDDETTLDSGLAVSPRHPDALVRAGADLMIAVGRHGDATVEGAWIAAIDTMPAVAWSDSVTDASATDRAIAVGDADGVWLVVPQSGGTTLARHYDAAGAVTGERTIPDFVGTSAIAQTMAGVAITGIAAGGGAAYVGVAADGSEVFNGEDNLAEGPYLVAEGLVSLFDGPGPATWEYDPRGNPDRGFPVDVGAERAIFASNGDILTLGKVLGPLGDATLLARVSPEGDQIWSQSIRRSHALSVHEAALETVVVVGESFHCRRGTYLAVHDAGAVLLQEGILGPPPDPWTIDPAARLAGVTVDGSDLVLRTYGLEVPRR